MFRLAPDSPSLVVRRSTPSSLVAWLPRHSSFGSLAARRSARSSLVARVARRSLLQLGFDYASVCLRHTFASSTPRRRSSRLARLAPRSSLTSLLAARLPHSSLLGRQAPHSSLADLRAPRSARPEFYRPNVSTADTLDNLISNCICYSTQTCFVICVFYEQIFL